MTTRSVAASFSNALNRWLPIKPAPPETKIRRHLGEKSAGTSDNAGTPGSVNLAERRLSDRGGDAFAAPPSRVKEAFEFPAGLVPPSPERRPGVHRLLACERRPVQ